MYLYVFKSNGFGEVAECIWICFSSDGFGELAACIRMSLIL